LPEAKNVRRYTVAAPGAPAPAKAEPPKVASLFDTTPEPVRTNAPADDGLELTSASSEIDEDEEILGEAYDEGEAEEGDEAA
jgi:hypothetical protein